MQSARPVVATLVIVALLLVSGCSAPSTVQAEDDDLGTVDVYEIETDAALSPTPSGPAHEIWTMFVDVVTQAVAADTFNAYWVGESSDIDTMAYVSRDIDDPTNNDPDVAYAFYETHEEDFVSDYAATNVTEDFAESFAAFVLEAEPDSDSPLAQKLDFFWNVPEFVEIRAHISEEFGLE